MAGLLALMLVAGLIGGGFALAGFLGSVFGPSDAGPGNPGAGTGAGAGRTTPTAGAPEAKAASPASSVCDEKGIRVTGVADRASYAPAEEPKLTLRVTNTGKSPCDINVGTSQMQYKITSGTDLIFNSRDCQVGATDLVKTLQPGASESANFTWRRNRSAPGCAAEAARPGGGGATYVFVATLGKWSSAKVVFQLQ